MALEGTNDPENLSAQLGRQIDFFLNAAPVAQSKVHLAGSPAPMPGAEAGGKKEDETEH